MVLSTPARAVGALLLVLAPGCARPPAPFEHEVTGAERPWTGEAFDTAAGKFTFAVFSDLNGGERPGIFDVAVQQLSLLRPELILSVGDLIDGATAEPAALAAEWDAFDARARRASAPVFRVGGNHDLTGSVLRDVWERRFGRTYYHFVYKDVLFLVLDTEDNTAQRTSEMFEARNRAIAAQERGDPGQDTLEYYRMPERMVGNIGPEQSAYFLDVLRRHADVRWTMLFMHKPVWTDGKDPEFVAIEQALANRPYTLFNGHLHTMSYTQRNGRDYIMLGTTGGGQPDDPMSFDHVTLVTVGEGAPSIAHVRLDGILDKTGHLPAGGDTLCFQASRCGAEGS
jgi:Calcineurin-like phosphoesterase